MMPRLSACRRFGVVLISCFSFYIVLRAFVFSEDAPRSQPPFHPVRSKFRNSDFTTAVVKLSDRPNDNFCVMDSSCAPSFVWVKMASESHFAPPEACLGENSLFEKAKLVKGLNVAVLSENGRAVEEVRYLSLLDGDHHVFEFLVRIADRRLVVMVSYGDVAARLTAESRQLLGLFGASLLEDYVPGKGLLFVGQYGLGNSLAFERVTSLSATNAAVYGKCFTIPLGPLSNLGPVRRRTVAPRVDNILLPELSAMKGRKMDVAFGMSFPNCGLPNACPSDQIAMSFYSGKDKNDFPKLCVDGKYVFDEDVNDAGRGLNLVVIDSKTRQVMRSGHFDTYEKESTDLVFFLEQLVFGEIVAVVSFDEASTRLSDMAKEIFYELGSSLIYNMKFRASWFLVGQKGIDGFTPFEDLILPSGSDWARPVNRQICVPLNLSGIKSRENTSMSFARNSPRRHFCERYDGFEDFCDERSLDEVLVPSGLSDRNRSSRRIFSYPVLLAGGLSANNIRLCLESLYMQEGINPQNIVVAYDAAYPEVADLAALFHTRLLLVNDSASYNDLLLGSLVRLMTFFPSAECVVVIEEDVILSADFFFFLDQLLDDFLTDEKANAILTWNKNGFLKTSSIPSAVYRVENFRTSAAFLLKRTTVEAHLKDHAKECCTSEAAKHGGWLLPGAAYMPDVSRVTTVSAPAVVDALPAQERKLFYEPRVSTSKANEKVEGGDRLHEIEYDTDLRELIASSRRINLSRIADCQPGSSLAAPIASLNLTDGEPFAVTYDERNGSLSVLARCFHLYGNEEGPYESYKGVLRFSLEGHPALLVSLSSPLMQPETMSDRTMNLMRFNETIHL